MTHPHTPTQTKPLSTHTQKRMHMLHFSLDKTNITWLVRTINNFKHTYSCSMHTLMYPHTNMLVTFQNTHREKLYVIIMLLPPPPSILTCAPLPPHPPKIKHACSKGLYHHTTSILTHNPSAHTHNHSLSLFQV